MCGRGRSCLKPPTAVSFVATRWVEDKTDHYSAKNDDVLAGEHGGFVRQCTHCFRSPAAALTAPLPPRPFRSTRCDGPQGSAAAAEASLTELRTHQRDEKLEKRRLKAAAAGREAHRIPLWPVRSGSIGRFVA